MNTLIPGSWIRTRHGLAVVLTVHEGWVEARYRALKCTHDDHGVVNGYEPKPIWVLYNYILPDEGEFVHAPTKLSERVLTLEGPYGRGWDIPPSPPVVPAVQLATTRVPWSRAAEIGTEVFYEGLDRRPDPQYYNMNIPAVQAVFAAWEAWGNDTLNARLAAGGWTLDAYMAASAEDTADFYARLGG